MTLLHAAASDLQARQIPLWLKVAYTLFVLVLIPFYTWQYGLANFLWFSNVALLLTTIALWLQSRLLITMQAIAIALPELVWMVDFIAALISGKHPAGMTQYMFDPSIPLFIRLLSLYHLVLPWMLVVLALWLGPHPRAWTAQTSLGLALLLITWLFTNPSDNINWVFGPGQRPQTLLASWVYLMLVMILFPVCVYLPTHLLLLWIWRRLRAGRLNSS